MEVAIRRLPPLKVAFVRHTGSYDQVSSAWDTLLVRAGPMGLLGPGAAFLGICHDDQEVTPPEKIRHDACITLGGDVTPEGRIGVQAIQGKGAPGGEEFTARIGALYAMAFTVKTTRKAAGLGDYLLCKLEALWRGPAGRLDFHLLPMGQWSWKLLVRAPDFVEQEDLDRAVAAPASRDKDAHAREVRLEELAEGPCVQMLHVGPYDKEGETLAVMKAFAAEKGLSLHGKHHEIHLSDPRRVPPERLETILRVPVR